MMSTPVQAVLALCLLGVAVQGNKRLQPTSARGQRSLVNTFPFNAQEDDGHAHGSHDHGEHAEPTISVAKSLGSRGSKQVEGYIALISYNLSIISE